MESFLDSDKRAWKDENSSVAFQAIFQAGIDAFFWASETQSWGCFYDFKELF